MPTIPSPLAASQSHWSQYLTLILPLFGHAFSFKGGGSNLWLSLWKANQLVSTQKKKVKKESSWFEKPRCKLGSKVGSNSSIQFGSNESKLVLKNLEPGHPSKVGNIIPTWVMNWNQPHMEYNLPCSTCVGMLLCWNELHVVEYGLGARMN